MTAEHMNGLYAAYRLDLSALEPLLVAVRRRAMSVMKDEDAAQEFTIGVWQALPIPHDENFSAWINVRLRHRNIDWIRVVASEAETKILFCEMENLHEF
jgi:DNA-directed RNA polymerase specialized sigma24 family protein